MPVLSTTNIDLHYERTGRGQPVLLLAGMASDSASWNPVVTELSANADIICMDNRCAGQTTPMPVVTSRSLMVDDIIALLDACDIEKVVLIGHSMGALNAWAVAAKAPERIKALVAASAPFTVDPARVDLFNTLARLRNNENEADWFRLLFQFLFSASFFADENNVVAAIEAGLAYPFKQSADAFAMQCAALPSYLEPIDLPAELPFPALALTGANDKLFTPSDLADSYAAYPHIAQSVIENAAHSVHWENAPAFIEVVSHFLADHHN